MEAELGKADRQECGFSLPDFLFFSSQKQPEICLLCNMSQFKHIDEQTFVNLVQAKQNTPVGQLQSTKVSSQALDLTLWGLLCTPWEEPEEGSWRQSRWAGGLGARCLFL